MTLERPSRSGRRPRNARSAAVAALAAFAADVRMRVGDHLVLDALSRRDAALAREIALGATRRQRLLDHQLAGLADRGLPDDPHTLACLRAGAQQILFLERVPAHAAVAETVAVADPRRRGFVNALLRRLAGRVEAGPAAADQVALPGGRRLLPTVPLPDAEDEPIARLAVETGLPDFLVERWWRRLGAEATGAIAAASVASPAVFLRTVRGDAPALAAELAADGVETAPTDHPRVLRWAGGGSPFASGAWAAGRFVAQDPTAVRAAESVGALAGETVLDLCAAPGTKTTLLAEAVEPGGRVLAHDIDSRRLDAVAANAARLGIDGIVIVRSLEQVDGPIDRVLADVPCSNTGVLARRVEVRHHLGAAGIAELASRQRAILERALALVRPGGTVTYSTCSLEPEENDGVVDAAVAAAGVTVLERRETLPRLGSHDGGYVAILRRPGP